MLEYKKIRLMFALGAEFRYRFSVLEESGWNFRHAYYHEIGRRTLLKAYGLKFIVQVVCRHCNIMRGEKILNFPFLRGWNLTWYNKGLCNDCNLMYAIPVQQYSYFWLLEDYIF